MVPQSQKWEDICNGIGYLTSVRYIKHTSEQIQSKDFQFHRGVIQAIQKQGLQHCKNLYTAKKLNNYQKKSVPDLSIWIIQFNESQQDVEKKLNNITKAIGTELQLEVKFHSTHMRFSRVPISKYYRINLKVQNQRNLLTNLSYFQKKIILTFTCENIEIIRINEQILKSFSKIDKISHEKYYDTIQSTINENENKVMWMVGFDNEQISKLYSELSKSYHIGQSIQIYSPTSSLVFNCENQKDYARINQFQKLQLENTEIEDCYKYIPQLSEPNKDRIKLIDFNDQDECIIHFFSIFANYRLTFLQFIINHEPDSDPKKILIQYPQQKKDKVSKIIQEMIYQKGMILYLQKTINTYSTKLHSEKFVIFFDPDLLKIYFQNENDIKIHTLSKFVKIRLQHENINMLYQQIQLKGLEDKIEKSCVSQSSLIVQMKNKEEAICMLQLKYNQKSYRVNFIEEFAFDEQSSFSQQQQSEDQESN